MGKFFKPVSFWAAFLNLIVFIISCCLIVFHQNLPPQIPLWFSKPWGQERLASPNDLWVIPILILSFFLSSSLIASITWNRNKVLARILVWACTFISLIFLLALYKIILLSI